MEGQRLSKDALQGNAQGPAACDVELPLDLGGAYGLRRGAAEVQGGANFDVQRAMQVRGGRRQPKGQPGVV
jgi:hypothetical protein